jgi:hypothetical protein
MKQRPQQLTKRAQRLAAAMEDLLKLEEELAFEQITVDRRDQNRHWIFFFRRRVIASYWPASAKGQVAGDIASRPCSSATQAKRLAIIAKQQLLDEVAAAMQGRPPLVSIPNVK